MTSAGKSGPILELVAKFSAQTFDEVRLDCNNLVHSLLWDVAASFEEG